MGTVLDIFNKYKHKNKFTKHYLCNCHYGDMTYVTISLTAESPFKPYGKKKI